MGKLISAVFAASVLALGLPGSSPLLRLAPPAAAESALIAQPSIPSAGSPAALLPLVQPSTPAATPAPASAPAPSTAPATGTAAEVGEDGATVDAPALGGGSTAGSGSQRSNTTARQLTVTASVSSSPPPASETDTGNPAANDTALASSIGAACYGSSTAACEQASVSALDAAMSGEGLTPTSLPADFWSLPNDQQLLVLANGDRAARGLPYLAGPDPTLDGDAATGAAADRDPVDNCDPCSWTSNWEMGPNTVAVEFTWMYDDGLGSGNEDCSSGHTSGCWVHRQDILHQWAGTAEFGGACAAGAHPPGESCAEIFAGPW
jgi:hypothetical protein